MSEKWTEKMFHQLIPVVNQIFPRLLWTTHKMGRDYYLSGTAAGGWRVRVYQAEGAPWEAMVTPPWGGERMSHGSTPQAAVMGLAAILLEKVQKTLEQLHNLDVENVKHQTERTIQVLEQIGEAVINKELILEAHDAARWSLVQTFNQIPQIMVLPTHCRCGGSAAFLANPGRMMFVMLGCVCHTKVKIEPQKNGDWQVFISRLAVSRPEPTYPPGNGPETNAAQLLEPDPEFAALRSNQVQNTVVYYCDFCRVLERYRPNIAQCPTCERALQRVPELDGRLGGDS